MTIRISKDIDLTLLLNIYLLNIPITTALTAVVGNVVAEIMVNVILFMLFFVALIKNPIEKAKNCIAIYSGILFIVLTAVVFHQDYSYWFHHEQYGLMRQFFNFRGGIWAALLISLYDNKRERLVHDLELPVILIFILYTGRFFLTRGAQDAGDYSMALGYRILLCATYWGSRFVLEKKKAFGILYILSLFIILLGGSRGPIIWALFLIFAAVPFSFRDYSARKKRNVIIFSIILFPLLFLLIFRIDMVLPVLASILQRFGVSSRTVELAANGVLLESNGRMKIYGIALELIRTGGLFGRGFYGDRIHIGPRFRWGYSHNIFLELFVSFGYVGGTILSLFIIWIVIKIYRRTKDLPSRIVFLTFFVCALKLLVSDSFWYEYSFWALIAIACVWKKQRDQHQNYLIS